MPVDKFQLYLKIGELIRKGETYKANQLAKIVGKDLGKKDKEDYTYSKTIYVSKKEKAILEKCFR